MATTTIPSGWNASAHQKWLSNNRAEAIQETIGEINAIQSEEKPVDLVLQLAYYFFLVNDYPSAATILEQQRTRTPANLQVLLNAAVCHSRSGKSEDAVKRAKEVIKKDPANSLAYDILANAYANLGQFTSARRAGTKSLEIKDSAAPSLPENWSLPKGKPQTFAAKDDKKSVIAFSLWGTNHRYLRGALRNLLLAPEFYPDWELRFYVDNSVPQPFIELLQILNGKVVIKPSSADIKTRLCWRFAVADDPSVGYFMVRDVDSVIGMREAGAVFEWLNSDKWFHVMRDWWTHTDLMLAGMWGGVAGVLPSLSALADGYTSRAVETPNIDQWFLRDAVWSFVRQSCFVHDRFFDMPDSVRLPETKRAGNFHIGQNEYAVRKKEQERFLKAWIEKYPCLQA